MRLHSRGRFNVKRLARLASDRLRGTPFDRALASAAASGVDEFVFGWNRGLGDIALGLVPLFARIRAARPAARILVFTRADLAQGFALTSCDAIHVVPGLARGTAVDIARAAAACGVHVAADAIVFADPDPTRWLDGRRQEHPPVLHWNPQWDSRAVSIPCHDASGIVIGAHVSSETARYYGYVKDWPADAWRALFARFPGGSGVRWVLFGHDGDQPFAQDNITDLRGRTDLLALLATLRTRCRLLVAPDSGILTLAYYLDGTAPLDVISLWSDPRQGILKQGCPSPNPGLTHVDLRGRNDDVRDIAVGDVAAAVAAALDRATASRRLQRASTH